jgi:flagellar biosynthetic protein FliR
MNALFAASQAELLRYLLIVVRVSPLMMTAPVLGSTLVPAQVRLFIALLLAGLLLPVVRGPLPPGLAGSVFPLAIAVAQELLLGFLVAYLVLLMFSAAQLAGQFIDIQVGFGIANVIDPLSSAQVTLLGQVQYLAALLIFLLLDGHHLLLSGLAATFGAAPLGNPFAAGLAAPLTLVVQRGGRLMFVLAAQIAAPVLTALFLSNFALGLISRMLPQMNIFLVGMPVNVFVGLLALAASLSIFTSVWRGAMGGLESQLSGLVAALRVHGPHG